MRARTKRGLVPRGREEKKQEGCKGSDSSSGIVWDHFPIGCEPAAIEGARGDGCSGIAIDPTQSARAGG